MTAAMVSRDRALAFARQWIEAWNAHDLDGILAHYDDQCCLASPYVVALMDEPSGVLKGKAQIRDLWTKALIRVPDLRLDLVEVFTGIHSIAIHYRTVFGRLGVEVLYFDSRGKVVRTTGHYTEI